LATKALMALSGDNPHRCVINSNSGACQAVAGLANGFLKVEAKAKRRRRAPYIPTNKFAGYKAHSVNWCLRRLDRRAENIGTSQARAPAAFIRI
jgi:hypothetical protein